MSTHHCSALRHLPTCSSQRPQILAVHAGQSLQASPAMQCRRPSASDAGLVDIQIQQPPQPWCNQHRHHPYPPVPCSPRLPTFWCDFTAASWRLLPKQLPAPLQCIACALLPNVTIMLPRDHLLHVTVVFHVTAQPHATLWVAEDLLQYRHQLSDIIKIVQPRPICPFHQSRTRPPTRHHPEAAAR